MPLPPLNASESLKTRSQLDPPLPCHPATVAAWSDFSNKVASHIATLDGSSQSYSPTVLPVTKVEIPAETCYSFGPLLKWIPCMLQMSSRESAVVFAWHSMVSETMNRILKQDGHDLQWQPDDGDLPTDSTVCVCSDLRKTSSIMLMLDTWALLQLLGGCRMPRVLHVVKLRVRVRHLTGSSSLILHCTDLSAQSTNPLQSLSTNTGEALTNACGLT